MNSLSQQGLRIRRDLNWNSTDHKVDANYSRDLILRLRCSDTPPPVKSRKLETDSVDFDVYWKSKVTERSTATEFAHDHKITLDKKERPIWSTWTWRLLLPTSTTPGRTTLFAATYFALIWVLLLWWHPADVSVSRTIRIILFDCERTRKYCGTSTQGYAWTGGVNQTFPVVCPDKNIPMPKGTFGYCDQDLLVSHAFASFIMTQGLSVIFWATVWVVVDHCYLRIRDPSAPLALNMAHMSWERNPSATFAQSGTWQQKLHKYYSSCAKRREMNNVGPRWRIWNALTVVSRVVAFGFLGTWVASWYWRSRDLTILTFLEIFRNQVLIGLGNDPNTISKLIYTLRHWNDEGLFVNPQDEPDKQPKTIMKGKSGSNSWENQCCMFIACHLSCSNDFETSQLRRTLKAALQHLPANQIFVCDNADAKAPLDGTECVVESIDPRINYLFIPVGNKSHAFYWTEKYWLPHLQQMGMVPYKASQYILTVDDDVRLPPNFSIPVDRLNAEPDIAAVQYPVTASDPEEHEKYGKPLLIGLQDIEYMALNQIPETQVPQPKHLLNLGMLEWCTPLYCSGAIAVWRRDDFGKVMSRHDTVFHGEDLQMGLILMSDLSSKRIVACDERGILIPTTAPSSIGDFIRQRVKSWDLIAIQWGPMFFISGMMRAIFNAARGHKVSMKATFWFFLRAVKTILGFAPTHFLALLCVSFWFGDFARERRTVLLHFMLLLVSFLLSYMLPLIHYGHSMKDIEQWRLPTMLQLLSWPLYFFTARFTCFLALVYHLTAYSHVLPPPSIASREGLGDVPPCPEEAYPNWDTVWKLGEAEAEV